MDKPFRKWKPYSYLLQEYESDGTPHEYPETVESEITGETVKLTAAQFTKRIKQSKYYGAADDLTSEPTDDIEQDDSTLLPEA